MRLMLVALSTMVIVTASAMGASPVRARLTTSTPTPVVDAPWRYTIAVKDQSGKPLAAKARLQILLGTTVVGCWKRTAVVPCTGPNSGTWIAFTGKRAGLLTWPAQSVGVKLTFQATVVVGTRSVRLRAPVTVQPKP